MNTPDISPATPFSPKGQTENTSGKTPSEPSVVISGTGQYLPSKVLTNSDLTKIVDTNEEWILTRTGISERRIAGPTETSGTMAAEAARMAIANSSLQVEDIDLVIVATITPDQPFPSTACHVQTALGMRPIAAFDVEAACSGFLYILDIATAMLRNGPYRHALIIGTEKLSAITDWQDRSTCILFGDGAGAAVLSRSSLHKKKTGILDTTLGADGANGHILQMPGGGCRVPATPDSVSSRQHFLKMNGREVFKLAVKVMEQASLDILARNHLQAEQIHSIIPHQANIRIIEMLASRLKIPMERFFINLDQYGNTSAASIPIALHEARENGFCPSGTNSILVGFGAGLTWGATLLRWP
ncbi:MAG: ketoacyl-ACP synthase III [Opitutales bacterium]|nr:ketoacyl-ACP synthase III [Opitutales bacterium]MCH8540110.1 ketoacyl-ACP synthase III [Opitutales bacterium]